MRYKYSVVNTSRWETETITEWVLYYRSIGFDHIYIYCNDDDPRELFEESLPFIQRAFPYVTFHHMPFVGQQQFCYLHFLEVHKSETEWFLFADSDEFLAIKGSNNIDAFMATRERLFDCINFNWIWFGPQDFEDRPEGSTLLQFTRREDHRSQMNYFTKSLTRSCLVDTRLIQRPPQSLLHHFWPNELHRYLRSVNVLGYPISEYNKDYPRAAEQYLAGDGVKEAIVETAISNHYLFRSRKDFLRRVDRGAAAGFYSQTQWANIYKSDNFEIILLRPYTRLMTSTYTTIGRDFLDRRSSLEL